MTRAEHIVTHIAEEAVEVAHRVTKALRFGMFQVQHAPHDKPEQNPDQLTNRERIIDEFVDLCAVMEMDGFDPIEYAGRWKQKGEKKAKVERYLLLAKQNGRLEEG